MDGIIPEGRIFRLVHDDELPSILRVLEKHLPYALKVRLTERSSKVSIHKFEAFEFFRLRIMLHKESVETIFQ